ncbi:DUF6985 domain-containing protein [Pseudomonas tohonis]|uniref:DUF6985 domain-containing protein n=1 Tax=Pseudomonas tohonis TaxID=2725477 RepID=UPI001F23E4F1|nr:hypothetical protein [Pseudomonas tohonis]
MKVISDKDFGELKFDDIWTGLCEVTIFRERCDVELVVQTFDGGPITETQRLAYREFISNEAAVCSAVEDAVFKYYNDTVGWSRSFQGASQAR